LSWTANKIEVKTTEFTSAMGSLLSLLQFCSLSNSKRPSKNYKPNNVGGGTRNAAKKA